MVQLFSVFLLQVNRDFVQMAFQLVLAKVLECFLQLGLCEVVRLALVVPAGVVDTLRLSPLSRLRRPLQVK